MFFESTAHFFFWVKKMLKKLSYQKISPISVKYLANFSAKPPKILPISAKCVKNLALQSHKFLRIFQHLRNAGKYHGRMSYLGLFSDKFQNPEFQVWPKIPHHFANIGGICHSMSAKITRISPMLAIFHR